MARGKPAPASIAASNGAVDDLAIMHPDVTLTVAGREVTVREYRFIDGDRARIKGKPLIAELEAMIAAGTVLTASDEDYMDVLAVHAPLVRELMADSIEGADLDWIEGLSEPDGQTLRYAWWGVCGRFFVRLVVRRMASQMLRRATASAGPASSTISSMAATAAATHGGSSGSAPSVN